MGAERQAITALLRRIAGVRLLVIGDFMLDRTIQGVASRISPEAPSPIVLIQQTREQLGGAGNVVRNLGSLGGKVWCAAVVGDDAAGGALEDRLYAVSGCQGVGVFRERERKTTQKTRIVAVQPGRSSEGGTLYGHHQMLRLDEESRHPISPETAARVYAFAAGVIADADGVVLSDYAKGALPPSHVQDLIALARQAGKPVFVDPKAREFQRYRGATALTPNAAEAEVALGFSFSEAEGQDPLDWEQIIRSRLEEWDMGALLITRGSEGLSLIDRQGFHHFPTGAREVFDVTGAGDTVLAAFALAASSGASLAEAAQLGNAAAAVAVGKAGAAVVYPYEIERELDARHNFAGAKIRTRFEMLGIAESLRREGKRIVFTNGCFDLLHVGHMHLLREAKKLGEVLVVGLNSDASVRSLKGDGRPIVPEHDRGEAIAALESVDYLVVFDEPDPMELIRAIRPEVLVKGGDYTESEVIGAEFLRSYGGDVALIPLREGISTSHLVEAIRAGRSARRDEP